LGEIRLEEVKAVTIIMKSRSAAAPGPNGIPYKIYKYCPWVALSNVSRWRLINCKLLWRDKELHPSWLIVPKEENSSPLD
jgi:hypothetical protein